MVDEKEIWFLAPVRHKYLLSFMVLLNNSVWSLTGKPACMPMRNSSSSANPVSAC